MAGYWPLLTALWVPEINFISYLWESADIRSAEDGKNEKTKTGHEKSLLYIYVLMFMLKRILNLCSIINELYNEWTVKFSVTNAIHVTVCKNVRGKGFMKSIKFQFN